MFVSFQVSEDRMQKIAGMVISCAAIRDLARARGQYGPNGIRAKYFGAI